MDLLGTILVASCLLLSRDASGRECFEAEVDQLVSGAAPPATGAIDQHGVAPPATGSGDRRGAAPPATWSGDRRDAAPPAASAVRATLATLWPGTNVALFGSLSTGLGGPGSDVDLAVTLPPGEPEAGAPLRARAAFRAAPHLYRHVLPRARLPALTLIYVPDNVTCDVHFRLHPTETIESLLLHHLLHADERALKLAVVVKRWAKHHRLIRTKYLTSYGMMMLVIFYLQQRIMLPSVLSLQAEVPPRLLEDVGFNMAFAKRKFISENNETLYELLGGFFEYYETFDFEELVVSPFTGKPVLKRLFRDFHTMPDEFLLYKIRVENNATTSFNVTALCIQSLLILNDNCAWRVDSSAKFQQHFVLAAQTYRDTEKCNFFKAIGISIE